jgi:hypothetical protein
MTSSRHHNFRIQPLATLSPASLLPAPYYLFPVSTPSPLCPQKPNFIAVPLYATQPFTFQSFAAITSSEVQPLQNCNACHKQQRMNILEANIKYAHQRLYDCTAVSNPH